MTDRNDPGEPIFSAVLTPHRSLGPAGFAALMAFVAVTCFAAGAMFYALGAWPIVGFMGLDVLAVYVAFRLNYRSARAFEEIVVTRDALTIRKVGSNGRAREVRFNPFWVKLEIQEAYEEGVTRIVVRARDAAEPIGQFLNPADRKSFAKAFGAALLQART